MLCRVLAPALVVGGIISVSASPAGATTKRQPGVSLWTKAYCQGGSRIQRRWLGDFIEAVYVRSDRICVFFSDVGAAGSHELEVQLENTGSSKWSYDEGYYSEYAGALAAPPGEWVKVQSSTGGIGLPPTDWINP